ncbi:MAG: 2-C-methyl-D-erythritol 4-phosphate cytidylyltransferase [Clostridiaceae bacterium]|nr:2-C-methyl-D-erythritol 4-phosphate cytidylyltransferase [Clostridiaceae bacterium]
MNKLYKATAIIVAAGTGSRMKTSTNKQYLPLSGKPVLAHTLEVFEKSGFISEIIVVINKEEHKQFDECILTPYRFQKIKSVVDGGADRQESVYNGLKKVSSNAELVCVHDGARPFVTVDIIKESVSAAGISGAACAGVPVKDTIKQADKRGVVEKTLARRLLWAVQTPQAFKKEILINAHEKALSDGFRGTDDCVLVERLGHTVQMVMGSYSNIKITTPEDLVFAEAIAKAGLSESP